MKICKFRIPNSGLGTPGSMRKIYTTNNIMLIAALLLIGLNDINAQYYLRDLSPQPRQAYVREEYSAVFTFSPGMKIYLNPEKPAYRQAMEFNRELSKRNIDTLEYEFINKNESPIGGVALGVNDELLRVILLMHT